MRITVFIDQVLYEHALALADPGIVNASDLCREALRTYIRIQTGRRLAALGANAPSMQDLPRRTDGPVSIKE